MNLDTQVAAADNLSITSGRDTNLRGAEVPGKTVDANVGRDLSIQSVQDTNTYDSGQVSGGFNMSRCDEDLLRSSDRSSASWVQPR